MTVKNLEESVEFYKKLFGFEVKKEQTEYKSKIIGCHIRFLIYKIPFGIKG